MTQWKEFRLGDVVEIIRATYKPVKADDYPYIGLEHIQEGALRLKCFGSSKDITSHKFIFKKNDILFGKLRPYFRKVIKPQFDGICSTDIWVFRAKKKFDQNFLFYFLANQEFVDLSSSADLGTRMPRADWSFLKDTEWKFPPLTEQRDIAAVLSCFDEKIALLYRQKKTLDAMADILWRKVFVEDADKTWEVCCFGDLAIHEKISVSPNKLPLTEFYHYSIPSFDDTWMPAKEFGSAIQSHKYLISCGSILFSKINPQNKRIWLVKETFSNTSVCSTEFIVLKPKKSFFLYFLYHFLKNPEVYSKISAGAGGTSGSHQRIAPEVILKFQAFKPDDKKIVVFNSVVEPLLLRVFSNLNSIQIIQKMRDSLLPKLISGEVRLMRRT